LFRAWFVTGALLVAGHSQASTQTEFTDFTAEASAVFQSCPDGQAAGPPSGAIALCQADLDATTAV